MRHLPILLLCGGVLAIHLPSSFGDLWSDYGQVAAKLPALAPTPMGDSHIGLLASGKSVQLRFPVPKEEVVGYWVGLGNIVAFSGRGSSYQLVLRRDAEAGPVIYEGPVILNGDEWNASNVAPIDLTAAITGADRQCGYVDIYATGIVKDDGWTIYRSNEGRPVLAYAAVMTPEVKARAETAKDLRARDISVIPIPREITLQEGEFRLTPETRIVPTGSPFRDAAFAATELRDLIRERTGLELKVDPDSDAPGAPGQIRFAHWAPGFHPLPPADLPVPQGKEGYSLAVTSGADGVTIVGGGEAGLLYAAMTLGQLARKTADGPSIPCCRISDAPAFPYRIVQYDIARGQTVNVDYVKRVIRQLARFKTNALLFYMEDDFKFDKYPFTGREGTFTPAKARELSAYARQYHMQLIPQFESLGHAGAVLSHPELKDLREGGDAWDFCTSEPKTWEFLDNVFGELVADFPDTEFIHVGGDEFEGSFGKCPRCAAKVARGGVGALYVEHMNKLNALVKKHGKTMLFWPAHWGPTPEWTQMSLRYADKMDHDCIPTEWIYHGPPTYPEIEQYQKAGYKDIFCSPAVESYSRIWPDHTTTFRCIQGFYRAGAARKAGGAYCTTWEFMRGALVENSWYGLIFSAECAWSPDSTSHAEFDRRFADLWWGLRGQEAQQRMSDTVFSPFPSRGPGAIWHNGWLTRELLWCAPGNVMREFVLKQPQVAANAPSLVAAMDAALQREEAMAARATADLVTLRAMRLAFGMMRYGAEKVVDFEQAAKLYREAKALAGAEPAAAAEKLSAIGAIVGELQKQAAALAGGYRYFVENCGAYKGDLDDLQRQAADLAKLTARVEELRGQVRAGKLKELPPGSQLGFLTGTYSQLGQWAPAQMNEQGTRLTFDATKLLTGDGVIEVEWQYTGGAHALKIAKTQLLREGQMVAEDVHPGFTGGSTSGNVYRLEVKGFTPGAKYQIAGDVASWGGTDSNGTVWLVKP